MKLPRQSRHVSKKLTAAISEVQAKLGHSVLFLDMKSYPDSLTRRIVRGYHDSRDGVERVWLDSTMPYAAQEAIAAHELAHVMQEAENYPRVDSIAGSDGHPLIAAMGHIAAGINNLVMDEAADLWATRRGFDMGKALAQTGLDSIVRRLERLSTTAESCDWDRYQAQLERLAREVKAGNTGAGPIGLRPEANTQAMSLDYGGLFLRLEPYGLFEKLDRLWAEHWPISRGVGKELAAIVKTNGVEDQAKCRQSLEKIIAFLGIPAALMTIR